MGWGGEGGLLHKSAIADLFLQKGEKKKKKVHGKERPRNLNTKQLFYYLRILKI